MKLLAGWAPRTDGYVVNNHGKKSPLNWGYSPYKWPKWLVNRGDPNHLRPSWDDPPSKHIMTAGRVAVLPGSILMGGSY